VNWQQLHALLWLRWRLARNQWSRGGQINAVISLIAAVLGLSLAAAGGLGGFLTGWLGLASVSPLVLMLVWDGLIGLFLMFWSIGLVTELQRSEIIDFTKLLHLPVSLRGVFVLNYLASHFSLSLAILLPAMAGLSLGLTLGRSPGMILLLPLALAFLFTITAWTYCLRGWLAQLMCNQRRRRAIVMGVTFAFILLAQLPNLASNVWLRPGSQGGGADPRERAERRARDRQARERAIGLFTTAHRFVPPLWLSGGARALAEGRVGPALLGTAGLAFLGALGLRRAYRSTLRFYRGGDPSGATPAPAKVPPPARYGGALLVERRIPLVPEEAGALALANLRSMMRAPEVKMALSLNVVIFGIIGVGLLMRRSGRIPELAEPFVISSTVLVTFLGLLQILFNQFGFDRDGFRALVLLPARRWHVLLGKNLSLLPPATVVFLAFLVMMGLLVRPPPWTLAAVCLQFCAGFLGLSVAGNLASILAPHRIAAGSLKPTRVKASTTLVMVLAQMVFPFTVLPLALPAALGALFEHLGWLPAAAVNLTLSALLCLAAALLYGATLEPLGRLLQRREQAILLVVTQEVE